MSGVGSGWTTVGGWRKQTVLCCVHGTSIISRGNYSCLIGVSRLKDWLKNIKNLGCNFFKFVQKVG